MSLEVTTVDTIVDWAEVHQNPAPKAGQRFAFEGMFDGDKTRDITEAYRGLNPETRATLGSFLPLAVGKRIVLLPPAIAVAERVKLRALDMIDPDNVSVTTIEQNQKLTDGRVRSGSENISALSTFATFIAVQPATAYLHCLNPKRKATIDRGILTITSLEKRKQVIHPLKVGDGLSIRTDFLPLHESEVETKKRQQMADICGFSAEPESTDIAVVAATTRDLKPGHESLRKVFDAIAAQPALRAYDPRQIRLVTEHILKNTDIQQAA